MTIIRVSPGFLLYPVFTPEFIDPAGRVQDFLFAGIERMALGADFDMQFLAVS